MKFDPGLKQGDIINNSELCDKFKCSPQGGMRRSHITNTLVIISDHTRSIYEDRWDDNNIFHYTGMGLVGDQRLDYAQNKTLAHSKENGIEVHLFEVFEPKKYVYQGVVELADDPYQEEQFDKNGNLRNVWIFPLKLRDYRNPVTINEEQFKAREIARKQVSKRLSDNDLVKRAKASKGRPGSRKVTTTQYERNQDVAEYAKRRAKGICQLCNNPAPFKNRDGEPYLEIHHIVWLSRGGEDTIDNTVALCPNCHRKMHVLDMEEDKEKLRATSFVRSDNY